MKKNRFIVFAILILLSAPFSSSAKFSISPSVGIEEKYNDNLFLSEYDREDDFITTINPAISLTYSPNSTLDLSLNYGLNFRFYMDHSERNDTSLSETQNINFATQFRPFNRVFIDITDLYQRVPIDSRANTVIDNPIENMTDSNIFRISPYVKIPITTSLSTQFGYSYKNVWFDADVSNNSESHGVFVSLTKKFPFPLSTSLNYDYLTQSSDSSSDYERHQGSVNASYQVRKDLSVWAQAGIAYFDFSGTTANVLVKDPDTGIPVRGISFQEDDTTEQPFWSAGANYHMEMFGGSNIGVSYSESFSDSVTSGPIWREEQEYYRILHHGEPGILQIPTGEYVYHKSSTITGVEETKRLDLYLTAGTDFTFTINPFYSVSETVQKTNVVYTSPVSAASNSTREDKFKGIRVSIAKPIKLFGKVTTLSADGMYQREEFSKGLLTGVEKNDRYSIGAGLSYKVSRSINADVGYRYSNKDSDIEGNNFYNNIAWIQARVTF